MSRLVILTAVIVAIVVGGMAFLAGRAKERPVTRIEQPVSLGNLT